MFALSIHFVKFNGPMNVHFHYIKFCYKALVETYLMVYITKI